MPPGGYETESTQVTKGDAAFIEGVDVKAHASYADAVAARISEQHRDYLLQRHGTLDLDPVPSMDPADPFNWPTWKVSDLTRTVRSRQARWLMLMVF